MIVNCLPETVTMSEGGTPDTVTVRGSLSASATGRSITVGARSAIVCVTFAAVGGLFGAGAVTVISAVDEAVRPYASVIVYVKVAFEPATSPVGGVTSTVNPVLGVTVQPVGARLVMVVVNGSPSGSDPLSEMVVVAPA